MILRRVTTRPAGGSVRAGFTLAELLAVVAILAILAGVAIPSYMAIVNSSRYKVAKSECKKFVSILKSYAMANTDQYPETGGYPAQEGDLGILVQATLLPKMEVNPWGLPYYWQLIPNPNAEGTYEPVVYTFSASNERIDSNMP